VQGSHHHQSIQRTMPELEVGLEVGAWSIDTDAGDERGSGSPPGIDGIVASQSGGVSTAAGLALLGGAATARSITSRSADR